MAENPDARHLVLAKSVGSLALPIALTLGIAGVWLTPLIAPEGRMRSAVERIGDGTQPQLLVGGTAEPSWDGDFAEASGASVVGVPNGNHSLETGSWRQSLAQVELVTTAIEKFAAALA